jgi:hypothetical protein
MMVRDFRGSPRECLAQVVEDRKRELMSRDRNLSELEAHRRASDLAVKENPDLLRAYRADSQSA